MLNVLFEHVQLLGLKTFAYVNSGGEALDSEIRSVRAAINLPLASRGPRLNGFVSILPCVGSHEAG
jgi:hypothetical protein